MTHPDHPEDEKHIPEPAYPGDFAPLSDIHSVLSDATRMSKILVPMENMSVRIWPWLKEEATEVCERNGTDLSTFLRQCALALVNDYNLRARDDDSPPAGLDAESN